MEHYKHYYQGKGTKALLHVEMTSPAEMNFKIEGDPVIVSKMITKAMEQKQDIAAAMMAAVIFFCNGQGIDCGELKDMVHFHKP